MHEQTVEFSVVKENDDQLKGTMQKVYAALVEKGYNPINQIVGYILSEDPTYITTYNNARSLIRHIDRDELLQVLVKNYLDIK
jgi:uncharacterized protein (UPF0297 family)